MAINTISVHGKLTGRTVLYTDVEEVDNTNIKQVLEDTAEHFGINAHLGVAGIVLVDSEVVFGQEHKEIAEVIARKSNRFLVGGVSREKASVNVWYLNLADTRHMRIKHISAR